MANRLGLTLGLEGAPLRDAIELCRQAEQWGYTDVWSAEVAAADGLSPLAALSMVTSSVRMGTAILPVYTRPPALVAMSAAALQDVSRGRFVLGLGTSSSIIVERWMGQEFKDPLGRERAYVEVVRAALSGEKVDHETGNVRVKSFRLQHPVAGPVPIYLAALGPKACRMAGEIADGVIFFLKSPDGVRQALEWVGEGARAAGRDPIEIDAVIRIPTFVDEDPDMVGMAARWSIASYGMVDVYNSSLRHQGFEKVAQDISSLWSRDRDAAMRAIPDEMIAQLFITGSRDEQRERIAAFREAGIKTPVLLPVTVAGDPIEKSARVRGAVEDLAP